MGDQNSRTTYLTECVNMTPIRTVLVHQRCYRDFSRILTLQKNDAQRIRKQGLLQECMLTCKNTMDMVAEEMVITIMVTKASSYSA